MDTMKECTVYKTMDIIGKKWALPIILELYKGPKKEKRFGEIKNKMEKVTPKILSTRLKELEKEGLIHKKIDYTTTPIKCEYALTDSGEDLISTIQDMKKWALKWKFKNKECSEILCKHCGG